MKLFLILVAIYMIINFALDENRYLLKYLLYFAIWYGAWRIIT